MTHPNQVSDALLDEIHELTMASLDGSMSPESAALLDGLVCRDDVALAVYLDAILDSCALRRRAAANHPVTPFGSGNEFEMLSWPSKEADAGRNGTTSFCTASGSECCDLIHPYINTILPAVVHNSFTYLSSGWPVAYLIATVILAVGAVIGFVTHVSHFDEIVRNSPAAATQHYFECQAPTDSVGTISGMVDCKWVGDAIDSPRISMGQKIRLASGLLEITYATGAKVIFQGPTTYEVNSINGGYLSIGKLTGKVETEAARGFVVRTPTATVTDLGTEFGIEVDKDGVADTQVFHGSVQVAVADVQGGVERHVETLGAGQCARVSANRTLTVGKAGFEERVQRFVRKLPSNTNTADAYAKLVLSMNPVVYYRMEEWPEAERPGYRVLVDSAPGGHHGVACFNKTYGIPSCSGKIGGAISLHGLSNGEYAVVETYPKATGGQISVSVWARAVTTNRWSFIIGNWHNPLPPVRRPTIGQFGICVSAEHELMAVIFQENGRGVSICENVPLPKNRWQHVAIVADGSIFRLYRNGIEVAASPYEGIIQSSIPKCLSIGSQLDEKGVGPRQRESYAWDGQLDEIAIFNCALKAEQVHQLYTGQADVREGLREQNSIAAPASY